MTVNAIILAAGQGTRMHSNLPKVLHPLAGKPLVMYSIDAVKMVEGCPILVIGWQAELIRKVVADRAEYAIQEEQLGTAHAVGCAVPMLKGDDDSLVLVLSADMPFLSAESLEKVIQTQKKNEGPFTMATTFNTNARGFGRILRDGSGKLTAIVEEAQATTEQRTINEINVGLYCFNKGWLLKALDRIEKSPKGEYYLTDVVALAHAEGYEIPSIRIEDPDEAMGINTRAHLAEAERILRDRINTRWMEQGVTIQDPLSTFIGTDVTLSEDVTILANTQLMGDTTVERGSIIGPHTVITDSVIGMNCRIMASFLEGATLEEGVSMGPFCHMRTGAYLAKGVHIGNFGEVKKSYLGPGTKMGHFSYVGNAQIGKDVNISAGVITCNFDGEHKNVTEIGDGAFIGSDTMLVAPVKIGSRAKTGAGAVVNRDVADDTLVVGVPARFLKNLK